MRPVRNQRVPWLYTKGVMQFLRAPALVLAFFVIGLYSPLTLFAAFGDGAPTVPVPNPFSGQSTQLKVDGPTGAYTQRVQLAIPSGRNGVQPDLVLEYNSQRTEDGIVGYGWGVSIPYIERLNKTGTQDLYGAPVFSSSMDGELIKSAATGTPYRARINTGTSLTYIYDNNAWVVYDKKGTRYIFGASDFGRQYDAVTASSSIKTFKWMLEEVRDQNGNYVAYKYSRNANELYPYEILYTGKGAVDGPFKIAFATSTRPDTRDNYRAGFKVTTNYRISSISAYVSGALVSSYTLGYGYGSNGKRSLLTSIQRTGYDEGGVGTTLPAYQFGYASSSQLFVAQSDTSSGGMKVLSAAHVAADINGNGRNDIAVSYINTAFPYNGGAEWYLDQGGGSKYYQGQTMPRSWSTNTAGNFTATEEGTRFVDANGDGKADVIKGYQNKQTGEMTTKMFLGDGTTWTATTSFSGLIPAFAQLTTDGYTLTKGLFGEVNGDGYVDFVAGDTYIGNGSAWATSSVAFQPVESMPTVTFPGTNSQLIDINKDGLDDWVLSGTGSTTVRLNTSKGWEILPSAQWTIGTTTAYDRGARFLDVNGDGLVDWVRKYQGNAVSCVETGSNSTVLLNTGKGWATSTAYTLSGNIATCNAVGGTQYDEYANWTANGQLAQDVLIYIQTPQGGTESVVYTPSAQMSTNPNLPLSLLAVTAIGVSDGFGTVSTTTFAYAGGSVYLDSKVDRRFAGFSVATTTAPDAITTAHYSQGNAVATGMGEQSDGFPLINRPFRKDVFDLMGTLLERSLYRYDTHTVGSSTFVGIGAELVRTYGANGEQKDKATEYQYATTTQMYDVTRVTEYGEVTGNTNGTFTDLGTDMRITNTTYASATTTATTTSFYGGGGVALLKKAFDSFFARATEEVAPKEDVRPFHERVAEKPQKEKETLKGGAISDALQSRVGVRIRGARYDIELVSIEPIPSGVEVHARVWDKDGVQIGFGRDGSVDVERFRFFNPPILVPDKQGDIVREVRDTAKGVVYNVRYRADPGAALIESLEHVVAVKKQAFGPENIVPKKVGNTTSTFYPASGGTAPVDGLVRYDPSATGGTWATARGNAGTGANHTDSYLSVRLRGATTANQWRTLDRSIAGFDTAALPDSDDVAAATLSVYGAFKNNTGSYGGLKVVVDYTAPASTNALVAGDFNVTRWDSVKQSNAEISFASWNTSGYNDYELNATGFAKVSKTGLTWFGFRTDSDLNNSEPGWENNVESDAGFYAADNVGTTADPKLVVEHSAFESSQNDVWVPLAFPSQETVTNQSGTRVKEIKYYYDSLAHGAVRTGDLTKRETWVTGSTYVSDQFAYNAYGLVASSTDPRGKVTTNTYDFRNLYVATSTNPLSQSTHAYYDYTLGKPKKTIDANGLTFETVYDGLDRPLTEKQPDLAAPASTVTKKTYVYTDTVGLRKVVETQFLDATQDAVTHKYYDGFDRPIQVRKEAEDVGQYVVRDFVYNTSGLLSRESLPYFSSGTSRTTLSGTNALFTNYSYDSGRRLLTAANAVGTTTTVYGAWSATTTDANGNPKGTAYDAFGRLVGVTESLGSVLFTTRYEYDPLGNLTKITDALENVRSFTYDGRSKRLTAQDLHAPADTTFGTWTYTYDNGGNLTTTLDPKALQVDYTYDDLSRVLTENFTGAAGTEVTYVYDTCTYGVGRLCIATSTGAATVQSYNALGLVATSTRTIQSTPYVTTFLYDRAGNQTHIRHPDNSWVRYLYNAAGLPETVAYRESNDVFRFLVTDLDYAPTERVTFKALGNGVQSSYTYDANALYRLTNIKTIASSTWSGGGPMAFGASQFMRYLAKATQAFPWALEGDLDFNTSTTESVIEEVMAPVVEVVQDIVPEPVVDADPSPISTLIHEKSPEEMATIKGREIAKIGKVEREKRGGYEIEILSMEAIEGGVQVFARAWDKEGNQIGFGADGSVDVERFRFFNPPILVPDERGTIERSFLDTMASTTRTSRYREDIREALLQSLEHVLDVKQEKFGSERIVAEKVGNTTSTFYPATGTTAPMDGTVAYDVGAGGTTWAGVQGQVTGNDNISASDTFIFAGLRSAASGWRKIGRGIVGFDTAPIANGDTVSAATLSLYGWVAGGGFSESVVIDHTVPGSASTVAGADYDVTGWDSVKQSDTELVSATLNTAAYNNFALNSTGRGNIDASGYTWFGVRTDAD
ncbi:MAG: hypothetical protein NBV63_00885, partial [Candidatus Pacebacteria bacterium]|nr:hypothetical protein [Candidatus Paceibacterota bacterium]